MKKINPYCFLIGNVVLWTIVYPLIIMPVLKLNNLTPAQSPLIPVLFLLYNIVFWIGFVLYNNRIYNR
jgi:hypothetical protein